MLLHATATAKECYELKFVVLMLFKSKYRYELETNLVQENEHTKIQLFFVVAHYQRLEIVRFDCCDIQIHRFG